MCAEGTECLSHTPLPLPPHPLVLLIVSFHQKRRPVIILTGRKRLNTTNSEFKNTAFPFHLTAYVRVRCIKWDSIVRPLPPNQINLLSFLSATPQDPHSPRPQPAPRIITLPPNGALTSRVCAFGAASLRRRLQRSFARVWWVGLHVWLLTVMVRI